MADSPQPDRVQMHAGERPSASLRTADGRWVRVHSGRDPVAEAERFVEGALGALPGGAPSVVLVIGPGLGYVIEAIDRRAPSTRIIALEPFAALAEAMRRRRDWGALVASQRLTLLVGPDYDGAAEAGRLLDAAAAASTATIEHPVMVREFPQEIARARAIADRILAGARLNAEARRMFAGRYLLNTLRNLPALAEEGDATALRGAFAGVPAIVVAAGPSLDAVLPRLRELQDRALIVAVDTTLRPLRAARIRPHLVVAVDPSELNAQHLLNVNDTVGSWLVSEGSIDPRVFRRFAGRAFGFKVSDHQPWPWLRERGFDRGVLRAWGSVLTTAFDLAIEAGCDPIAFVGADLAYTGGLHYARGTMNENAAAEDASNAVRVQGFAQAARALKRPTLAERDIRGVETLSTPQFVQFRDWLTTRAAEAAPRRIVNATGAGILHGHAIEQADLASLVLHAAGGAGLRDGLAAIWRGSVAAGAAARRGLEEALAGTGERLPMTAWLEFGGATVQADAIEACIRAGWRTPPAVVSHPRDAARLPGRLAVFVAEASGGPSPSVQWQVSRDEGRTWVDVAGANAGAYARPMDAADAGHQYRARFANRHGAATSEAAALRLAAPGVPFDFDGNGRADILWRHDGTGLVSVWSLRDGQHSSANIDVPAPDLAWRIVAVGDFDGDGRSDLLWRHRRTGELRAWFLDGLRHAGEQLLVADVEPGWSIAGTGDFGGPAGVDLLWHHPQSGALEVWRLDGLRRTQVEPLALRGDAGWIVSGVGDFDGDGKPDLVWREATTGAIRVAFTDGRACLRTADLDPEPDTGWQIVGTQDFNGDGRSDLLWRHQQSGENRVWLLHDLRRVAAKSLPTVPELGWVICPELHISA